MKSNNNRSGSRVRRMAMLLVGLFVTATTVGLIAPTHAGAHNRGQSYLYLDVTDETLGGRVELPTVDIEAVLGIDFESDPAQVIAALEANNDLLVQYAADHVTIGTDTDDWTITFGDVSLFENELISDDWGFVLVPFTVDVPAGTVPRDLTVGFDPFLDDFADRDAVVLIANHWQAGVIDNEGEALVVFDGNSRRQSVDLGSTGWTQNFTASIELGVDHIRTGPDHIFFVLVLLLPSVLFFTTSWQPAASFGAALWRVLKIATMFTVAHSITFTLAGLDLLPLPPSRLTESVIALSIALAALHNLRPIAANREWAIAFAFGLFHGMGFASLVGGLDVSRTTQLVSLLGRNVGIEIGQAVVILLIFPGLYIMRATKLYRPFFVFGSLGLAAIAFVWTIERAFNQDFNISVWVDQAIEFPRVLWAVGLFTLAAAVVRWREAPTSGPREEESPEIDEKEAVGVS